MSARIIVIANQKGGSGKTTLTMVLAGTLGSRGARVLVIDADAQGTATHYVAAAPDEQPFPAKISGLAAAGERIHREIRKNVEAYDVILVDCPPSVDAVQPQSALLVADLALVPVIPSPADLWAAVGTRRLIERIRMVNPQLRARLVANATQSQARLTRAVLDQLGAFGIPLMRAQLSSRTAFRQAMALGLPVQALGPAARPAIEEAEALTEEVLALLAAGHDPAEEAEAARNEEDRLQDEPVGEGLHGTQA